MIYKPFKNTYFLLFSSLIFMMFSCKAAKPINSVLDFEKNFFANELKIKKTIVTGAQQTNSYVPLLINKNVAIVANQTSVIFKNETNTHIVDSLVSLNVLIKKVFSPEHGFRGTADASELVADGIDKKTGIPIVSLYGNNKKTRL